MLIGQEIGPFRIERELGSGAMGTVYLGVYQKTGAKVAVKVLAPNMATSEQSVLRFKREAAILKQFDHPNIVRIFAVGKHEGMRYYAMECIQGQSLDHVLLRRGRLSWEEVAGLGQQLCSALQHSHEKGVIHRDLKPSNLMLLKDGTIKLTDFGIAKDLDVTQLTEANCTVGTASYMSPEQCRGERDLTHKSDLYSLGIVFYELITGKKPFVAENVMDMFLCHTQGTFERPSRLVPELPPWFDTLICQLMEKKPEQRPFDAAKVATTLQEVLEKHETQVSAGLDLTKRGSGDSSRRKVDLDERDREAAKDLMAAKKRRKRKPKKKPPFYTSLWFMLLGVAGIIGAMALVVWMVFLKPPSAEGLYERTKGLMESRDTGAWLSARRDGGFIEEYFEHYGADGADDPERQRQMRAWAEQVDLALAKEHLRKLLRLKEKGLPPNEEPGAETKAFEAAQAENEGDMEKADALWQAALEEVKQSEADRDWGMLAREHRSMIARIPRAELEMLRMLAAAREYPDRTLQFRSEEQEQAFGAIRYEEFRDTFAAQAEWKRLKEEWKGDWDKRFWFLLAAHKVEALEQKLPTLANGQTVLDYRKQLITSRLANAAATVQESKLRALGICQDVIALYQDEEELAALVRQAKELYEELKTK